MKKIPLLILSLLILSCSSDYNYYPKVIEVLTIKNETNFELYFLKNNIYNEAIKIERAGGSMIEISGYEYDLWLSEAQFEDFLSDVIIFRVNDENDTVYIDPVYYRKKTNWTLHTESYHDWGEMKTNYNILNLNSSMFLTKE